MAFSKMALHNNTIENAILKTELKETRDNSSMQNDNCKNVIGQNDTQQINIHQKDTQENDTGELHSSE